MIQAILVDDERLALMKLEHMLKELGTVNVVATYTDPVEAVKEAGKWNADVIFLDIDMPEMNGLQAAEIMHEHTPEADIVFVTAYNNYALEAFEVNALDYVLKPVIRDRLLKTISRLEERTQRVTKQVIPSDTLMVRCFPSLRFERGGVPLNTIRWRTNKAQELFALLLHNRNRFVSKDTLIDMLWPDFNLKKASTHLYTTIYQVRQCLRQAGIELLINNVSGGEGYTLESGSMLIDSVQWENGILTLDPIDDSNFNDHQRLFDLYSGDYYGDYDYLWAESERQRLRTIWLHHAIGTADYYIGSGRIPEAVTVYQRIVQLQPYFEQGHLGLMKVYDSIGERFAVEEQYKALNELLKDDLSTEMPSNIERWYSDWKLHNLKQL
ncbi:MULTISPECIES: response regulator [Paenibacillus]|uniref:Response regulator n=1 Tax=Paenibacillus agri TaxID=2744309 RepID=A0A850EMP8_9BACL|nr:response regulator [Paenibacillus agri]NUU60634.1 response regulator [Paenibacillus agri]